MTDPGVVVLGIPIPSSSPLFLSIVAVHVVAGLICTVAGIVAMLTPKRAGRHPSAGLSILRWPHNTHLFVLGILSFGVGTIGRTARRRLWRGWLRLHITGMAVSYILLLTAFYVDNEPHLPLWRSLPPLAFWLLPSLVGLPLVVWALRRHPLVLRSLALRQPSP